jgi:hypothetical protein
MNGRERVEAAFSPRGTPQIPAVICYEDIFIRDHWSELTGCPWWYASSPHLQEQLAWRREAFAKVGQDWFWLQPFFTRAEREDLRIEVRPEGVFRVSRSRGTAERLQPPRVGGWSASDGPESVHPQWLPRSREEVDGLIPEPGALDIQAELASGKADLAHALLQEFSYLFPIYHLGSPLWSLYTLWGFEGLMMLIADRPDLVEYACQRRLGHALNEIRLAAALGARGIWIEECLLDMISPKSFASLNLPLLRRITAEIRNLGMRSIYYYCGNPAGKWEHIFSAGADALALEESKKGFQIEIEEVVERAQGRCVVLGNLDAIAVLEQGSEEVLRAEIERQIAAGRRNGSRFIMSTGSPVTPGTPVERVRRYCELVRELGS